jgi:uncharacterized BrkB/YihY/UPF0761 family membrane protein
VASANPLESAQEAQQMLVAYAKQETIDPLKDLGWYLGWGLGGAVSIFLGVMFLALGLLRGLQQLETFDDGFWTVIPYTITVIALVVVLALIALLYSRAKKRVLR